MSQTFVRGSLAAVAGLLLVFGMSVPCAAEMADKQEQNLKKKEQLRDLQKAYDGQIAGPEMTQSRLP